MPIRTEYIYSITVCTENNATHAMVKTMVTLIAPNVLKCTVEELPKTETDLPDSRCTRFTFKTDDQDAITMAQSFLVETFAFLSVEHSE